MFKTTAGWFSIMLIVNSDVDGVGAILRRSQPGAGILHSLTAASLVGCDALDAALPVPVVVPADK